jgi:Beta-propeller repeat
MRTLGLVAALFGAMTFATACSDKNPADETGESSAQRCQDGQDNDGDGDTDCKDTDCANWVFCGSDGGIKPDKYTGPCNCDDGLTCTDDICKAGGLCEFKAKAGFCAVGGKCYKDTDPHPSIPCLLCDSNNSGNQWTSGDGTPCDDQNLCTKDDTCVTGICKGSFYTCSDAVECTQDLCDGKGGCTNPLKTDSCQIAGACYNSGDKDPSDKCNECDPTKSQSAWTAITGGCNISGTCYKNGEKDSTGCNICDPVKSTTALTPITGGCTIAGTCYAKGDKDTAGCNECDPATSTTAWTPLTTDCTIDGACYKSGDKAKSGCGVCDPTKSATAWSVVATKCLISSICYDSGDMDAGGCKTCAPATSQTAWTPGTGVCEVLTGLCVPKGTQDTTGCNECDPATDPKGWTPVTGKCKIGSNCYADGALKTGGCAKCDTATSTTAWTPVAGKCLISDTCYNDKDQDSAGCQECAPATSQTAWSPVAGKCKIGSKCYTDGTLNSGGCAKCDTATSSSSWTPVTGKCLINNSCYNSAAKDSTGCYECTPATSQTAWSFAAGKCMIGGTCVSDGALNAGGCAKCDSSTSTTTWTPLASKCLIGDVCYNSGVKHTGGCATCAPATSQTAWTSNGVGCLINASCFTAAAKEPGGCATCVPGTSSTGWTRGSGCLVTHKWSKRFGGKYNGTGSSSSDYGRDVATDSSGNVYIIGYGYYDVDLGGGMIVDRGGYDVRLSSYDKDGKHRWSRVFGSTSSDYGYGVTTDTSGNVYITGYFYGTADFGGASLVSKGSSDVFLASYDKDGKHRWSKGFGGTSSDYGYDVATDSSGNVYVTGYFNSAAADFGGATLATKGSADVFLASYTAAGAYRWAKGFGTSSYNYGYAVAVDSSDNVYLTGYGYDKIDFGGGAMTGNGGYDIYLASYTAAGVYRWAKLLGGTSSDYGYGIAASGSNIYLTGRFYYSGNFGASTPLVASYGDIFLASYTAAGAYRWAKKFGSTSSSDYGRDVTTDASGNVYITGDFYYTVDFGGGGLVPVGGRDIFIASYTAAGAHRWSRNHGSSGSNDYGYGVAAHTSGAYATGQFYSTVDFGGGGLTSLGYYDVYLLKVGP